MSGLQVLVRALLGGTEPIVHEGFSAEAVLTAGADHVSVQPLTDDPTVIPLRELRELAPALLE